ncbi:unnamed protein product [Orchesella dallaii]|uniref:Neurogenic locus Notch protein n=1 Tax=Orchesella dallaii TaxID=48710 RepID=A0ABP1QQX1_9HEXA
MGKLISLSVLITIGIQLASSNPSCVPGWNITCNNRGSCNPSTNTCQCDKLPFRCGSQTKSTNVFDFNNRCASITHGCFYELTPGGEVSQHLCNNRGCCASLSEQRYTCKCDVGYTGKDCEKKDPCYISIPGESQLVKRNCSNHGTCHPSPTDDGTAFCRCEPGYSGGECENGETAATGLQGRSDPSNDPCAPAPCLNGGICLVNPSDPNQLPTKHCSCPEEYIGQHCEIVNPCYVESPTTTDLVKKECNNRGACKITGNGADFSYECNCRYGYWFKDCQYTNLCQIDETGAIRLPNEPCNGGMCRNHSWGDTFGPPQNSFDCECDCNKTGQFCQFPNPCTVSPCINGGNCTLDQPDPNRPPIVICKCPDGFVGKNCEYIDPCTTTPCENGGMCSITQPDPNEPPIQSCKCPNGYIGQLCEHDDPCAPAPCLNGGTCLLSHSDPNQSTTKDCSCPDEYIGQHCEIANPCYVESSTTTELDPRECNNHGHCKITGNGTDFSYECNCQYGYWFKDCQYTNLCQIDETGVILPPNEPCNGGTCRNHSWGDTFGPPQNSFDCECDCNKTGQFCQFPNPCTVSPCVNGGNCTINYQTDPNKAPTRNCTCRDEYAGETCNLQSPCYLPQTPGSDPTVPRDCNNRGDCIVVANGTEFVCNCSLGFWGQECNFTDLCKIDENGSTQPPDQPCNGGTCVNSSIEVNGKINNTFRCDCPNDKVGQLCQFPNPCVISPCQNGGNCTINNHTDPVVAPTRNCTCRDEYVGETCNLPSPCYLPPTPGSDPTIPRECNNQGDCLVVGNGTDFQCNCSLGSWGPQCNFTNLCMINESGTTRPPDEPCNGGVCVNSSTEVNGKANDTFTCACPNDKVGLFCQFPNPCVIAPCQNGGNCVINNYSDPHTPSTRNCSCRDGYVGETCNLPSPCYLPPTSGSDPTIQRDCNNQGDCMVVDNGTAFICKCAEGVWGPQCNFTDLCMINENGTDRPPNKPCNGGACHNQSIEVNGTVNNTFTCICPNETVGQLCEFPNPCFGMPCENGGICSVSQLSPIKPPIEACNCSNGFVGRHCEYVDPCTSTPCNNGGACSINQSAIDEPPLQICTCPDGYLGWRCEFVNPCTAGVCHNGGTCLIHQPDPTRSPTQTCNCTLEFVGKYCQFVNPCTATPCQNGGSCTLDHPDPNQSPIQICKCPDGFVGKNCEYTDPCTTTPCENGGMCSITQPDPNEPPIQTCECPNGYIGQLCEHDDPCAPAPCLNGGICLVNHSYPNQSPTKDCTCPDEYIGQHCEIVNPCYVESPTTTDLVPRECNNRGQCKITVNGTDFSYECDCRYGYWSKDCNYTNLCQIDETGVMRPPNKPCNGGTCNNESIAISGYVIDYLTCTCPDDKLGEFCQFPNPCTLSPCQNGGSCVISNPTDPAEPPSRNCTCRDEYAGETCNLPSPCYLPPITNGSEPTVPRDCNNRGDCMVVANGTDFVCNCTLGFWGAQCNFTDLCKVDQTGTVRPPDEPCNSGACSNSSIAVNGQANDTFTCSCPYDKVGQFCQFPNPCIVSPCQNGGKCTIKYPTDPDEPPTRICTCRDEYVGETCNLLSPCYIFPTNGPDPTVPRDCNNKGDCMVVDNGTDFHCNCSQGSWGSQCNFTNLCIIHEDGTTRPPDQPCNGGACNNKSIEVNQTVNNTFTCSCPIDKVGEFCQFPNPCTVSPCQNGGSCTINNHTDPAKPPSRNCTCRDEYAGETCNLPSPCYLPPTPGSDPTDQRDCNNQGDCMVVANGTEFMCNCTFGVWGPQCNFTDLCKIDENGITRPPDQLCNGGACVNSSTEVNGKANNTFICDCPHDQVGQLCQFPNPCSISPCQNGGNCVINNYSDPHTPSTRNCSCRDGYVGETCNLPSPCYLPPTSGSDPTIPRDCNNQGDCMVVDNGTAFICKCAEGVWGTQCNFTDLCLVNENGTDRPPNKPCNGGACHNQSIGVNETVNNTFTCICPNETVGQLCEFPNPCFGMPCENGGICSVSQLSPKKPPIVACNCSNGFVGRHCEYVDPCTSTPCINGGACSINQSAIDEPPLQICTCPDGYIGWRCEFVNPCTAGACHNGGTCLIHQPDPTRSPTQTCNCTLEFVGKYCQFVNPCTATPCQNGGSCTFDQPDPNRPPIQICKCPDGFVGQRCEYTDPCTTTPCENGGVCSITQPDPNEPPIQTCECPNGYIGQLCEHDDPCAPAPCLNGGICLVNHSDPNQSPTKDCTCPDEYIGQHCEIVNPCYVESPTTTDLVPRECNNRGQCKITVNGTDFSYKCDCRYGYWSKDCNYTNLCEIDETGVMRPPDEPCNGGVCVNSSTEINGKANDTFTCSCPNDKVGQLCQFPNPCMISPCQNGGNCIINNDTDPYIAPTRNCSCRDEYAGETCNLPSPCYLPPTPGSDPTVPRDCNNQGDCIVVSNGTEFVCNCSLGFWGQQCNFTDLCKIDENGSPQPPDQPCNGGTCVNSSIEVNGKINNTFMCDCPNDQLGQHCQFPNPCVISPCQNGGSCAINNHTDPAKHPSRNCTCRDEYVGETCNLPSPCYIFPTNGPDPTVPRDCNNKGDCMVVDNGTEFHCNCSQGSWGSQCNFTNLCIIHEDGTTRPPDQPCNGGACNNKSIEVNQTVNNTFTCSCPIDKVGEFCQFPNPCTVSPCQNGGSCTINNHTDPAKPPSRNCTCRDEYAGETCNLPSPCYLPPTPGSDPTDQRDCNNQGYCIVVANGTEFVCNCTLGFWGSQCNFTDLCTIDENGSTQPPNQPCNGGTCANSSIEVNGKINNTFMCDCPNDQVGKLCQFPNPCTTSPCQNGGSCAINNHTDPAKPPSRNCTCRDGYVGETCNLPSPCYLPPTSGSDPTVPRDCNNQGDCLVVGNGTDFQCNCSLGFWGPQCNFTNLCKINENGTTRPPDEPCNGGVCVNSSTEVNGKANDTFTCACPNDKVGQLCQFPNPCVISPCQNGGNCVINNYSDPHTPSTRNCSCRDGYVGETCNLPSPCYLPPTSGSDPTIPRDCNNQGDCMVVDNGTDFICNCSHGFWGRHCNFTDLCKIDNNGTARPPGKPCNGGVCRNESVEVNGSLNNTFTCTCSNDAVGQFCQFPNPCFDMPCKNGGTCNINQTDPNQKPNKNCTCLHTHIGESCQIINPCYFTSPSGDLVLHDCNERGNCSLTADQSSFICNCQHGFWGRECEFINLCLTDEDGNIRAPDKPCNGGTCSNISSWLNTNVGNVVENTFTCKCPPDRLGMFCEFEHPCLISPCINDGTCQLFQMTPASVPTRICSCPDGYFGDRCEQINPCYFNSTYCQNSAICVREDNYTMSCNCSRPYFEGSQCETVNLCHVPSECEIFNGGMEYCNPCKNGGECMSNFTDPTNIRYTCNCNGTNYGGQFCEHTTGKLLIIPEDFSGIPTSDHVDSFAATGGYPHNFFIIALLVGDEPTMDFYTGDGFSMKLQPKLFRPVDKNIPALSAIDSPNSRHKRALSTSKQTMNHNLTTGPVYFLFPYSYSPSSCPDVCKMTAVLRNFGVVSSVRETTIRVVTPPEIPCVPNSGLRNVGHFVNDAPDYKRTSRFVVEANLKFECFEENWLDPTLDPSIQLRFQWALHKLSYFFPAPSAENDWHVEKLTPVTEKYLVFEPHVLVEGFYWVECRAIVRIGNKEYGNSQLGFFKIVQNPPRIILKESTTRYVDGDKEILIDASESIDDSFPEHTPYLKYIWTCELPCAEGPWEGSILRIPGKTFKVGDEIKIRLSVKSNHARTTASEVITLHIGSKERMSVRCVRNCEKFNPGDEVVFECIYEINGIRQPVHDTELEWLPIGEVTPTFNIEEEPFMTSVVLPVVKDPSPRAIICRSARPSSSPVSAQMEFRINMPPILPHGGACFITPYQSPQGPAVYLVTRFRMECNKRFVDPHEPLRYSFYAQPEGIPLTRLLGDKLLLNYDTNPKTEEVFLPLGSINRNPFASWRMKVILKVTDDLGLSTELSVYTYIKPPDMGPYDYPTLLENLVFGDKSLMKRRFLTGDNQGVLQLQMVVAYGLNRPTIINTLTVAEQYKMLSDMEHTLISVPLHSFKITEQKITAAHFIDHIEDRPATDVLTEVSLTMFQSASQMVEYTKQGEEVVSPEQVDSLARASADSASRLLRASYSLGTRFSTYQPNFQLFNRRDVYDYHTDDNVGRDYYFEVHDTEDDFDEEGFNEISESVTNEDVKKYAKVSHHALFAFERVMDAAVENLGYQADFYTNTDKVGLHAEVLPELVADYTATAYTKDGIKTDVTIPKNLHDILKDKVENDLELQITEVTVNPFYDDSSANPHTPVVNLILKDSKSHVPVLLEDLPYPLDITLFFNPPPSNALDAARTEHEVEILPFSAINENTEFMIFKLDLPYDTNVNIEIDKVSSTTMLFKIIALKDHRPTLPIMCSYPLLDVVSPLPRIYQASFSTETLRFNETAKEPYLEYYIGILPLDPNAAGTKQKFRLLFTRVACLHRDEDRKFWSEEGCILNTSTDPNANQPILHCSCRHASILTGVQFIAPHYLETINILDFTLEEIQKNPVVLITVCTMLVIYLIGLIICAVYDKRDREKNFGLTIMADLRESNESQFYLITIVTGCNFWAGTTSTVSLILYGSSGRSKTYTLKDESLHVFLRGGIDTFLVSSDKDLGDLEKIRIWIDYSGSDPAWFCRRILVRQLRDNETKKWYFYIHKWFSITDKSATIIMEIPATTRPERKMFSARFRENLMEQIDNVNLWFSIFRYSPSYTFTRCQRLSCAFAVLTSYLLINIMFYGMLTEDENGFYEVGEFTLNLYAIIKSFQVVILSVPFGVLVITLFRYILAQYIPTLIIWKNVIPAKLSLENKNLFIPKTNDETKNYQHTPPRKNDTDSDVKIAFDSDEEEIVPLPETIRTGVQRKSFDATSNTSSKSNFSIPSTDIPQLEEWLEDRTKQYRGYTAKLVGASSDEDDGDQTEQEYPDKFITTLDEVDEEERFTNRLERLGRLAIITSVRDSDPDTFIFQGDNDIPQIEALIDEQIKWRRSWKKQKSQNDDDPELNQVEGKGQLETVMDSETKSEFKKAKKTPWKDTVTTEYLQKIDKILDEEMETRHKLQNQRSWKPGVVLEICLLPPTHAPRCSWPYWFVVVSWIVCLLTIFLTCYFTLLYGLHYGYLRSVNWLHSYIRSFFISVLIVQPLNAVIATFLSTLFGKDQKVCERVQVLFEDNENTPDFLESRLPYKFTVFQPTLPHPPLSGPEIFRLTIAARRKHELRSKLLRLILCVLLLLPLIAVSYSGHNKFDYDITENVRNMLQLNNLGEGKRQFKNEDMVYQYMEKVILPNLHPEKWYNGQLIPQPTPIQVNNPAVLSDLQTFLIGVGRVRQQRVKPSACIEQDQIAIGKDFRCNAEYKKITQDQESYNPSWDPVTGTRLPSSLTNDGWEFHGKDSKKTLSFGYTGKQAHYDGGGYILELGRTHRESESVIKFMRTHHWLDHRTRAVFIELTLMNPNINKFVDVVLLIEQSATWAFTMKSWISPITLIPIEDFQESNDLIWVALNIIFIVAILIILFCLFISEAISSPNSRWLTSPRFWFDMTIISLSIISLCISIARFISAKEVSDVIERQRIDEYVSVQRAAYWYEIEGLVFSITQTVVFIKIWKLIMFTDRRFLSFALTLKLTAGFLLGFLIILSIFLFAFAFAGHFLFGQDLWEFSTLNESLITLVDQILGVSLFDEFAQANPILGPVYAFLFGFLVVFIGLNFVVALLDLGVHEAKEVVAQRKIWLTYTSYFVETLKKTFPIFQRRFQKEQLEFADASSAIPPDRMQGMKDATATYLRQFLSSTSDKMREMEAHCNKVLAGTGYRMVNKKEKEQRKELEKQQHIDHMRAETATYIKDKIGYDMKPDEMKKYADFNKEIVKLRIKKMEQKMEELSVKVDELVESLI